MDIGIGPTAAIKYKKFRIRNLGLYRLFPVTDAQTQQIRQNRLLFLYVQSSKLLHW